MGVKKHKTPKELCEDLGLEYNETQEQFVKELTKQLILRMDKSLTHWTLVNLNIINYMKGKE